MRISASKKMLQEGYFIQDAFLLAGYVNLSAFYDHFHRETGMTPSRYRQLFANNISREVLDTPIGKLSIYASKEGILCVKKAVPSSTNFDKEIKDDASGELVKACEKELSEYFSGKRKSFDLPLLPEGSDFQKKVWEKLLKIPYGETRTYGELAEMTGDKKASRAVGMANNNNPILILIPCHRVIGSDGSLTGYVAGVEAKKYLLQLEKENQK